MVYKTQLINKGVGKKHDPYQEPKKQSELFDPWGFPGPTCRKLLDQSWAGLFQKKLLGELPVGKLIPFFTRGFGATSKAAAVNIFKATAIRRVVNNVKPARVLPALKYAIFVFKERFLKAWGQLRNIFTLFDYSYRHLPMTVG